MAPLANVIVGVSYIVTSLFCAFSNGLVGFVILRNKEYHTDTYRIFRSMLIGCLMQLSSLCFGGVITATDGGLDFLSKKIAGALLLSGWLVYMGSSLALAVDRTLTFISIFREKTSRLVSLGFLASSWLCAIVYFVCLLLPSAGITYFTDSSYGLWFYDDQPNTNVLETTEMILDFSVLAIVMLLYMLVCARIAVMRKSARTENSSSAIELRILSIAIITFLYESTCILGFFWGDKLFKDENLLSIIMVATWIIDCGFFSMVTIVINTSIREKILLLWPGKKSVTSVKVLFRV